MRFGLSGKKLSDMRIRAGMTKKTLAGAVGTHYNMIRKYESEETHPSFDRILAICDVLQCHIDEVCIHIGDTKKNKGVA